MANAIETKLNNAKDVARNFLIEDITEQRVGEYLGFEVEGENTLTHKFKCVDKAYFGWHWSVTLAVTDDSSEVTVSEILLLPGEKAILAKPWVPWEQRVEPGDIGVGDVLPTAADDVRLVPGYTGVDDLFEEKLTPQGWEVGLGRFRVLSVPGKDETAIRWYDGDRGPRAAIAEAVTDKCVTCGFYVAISGSLGQSFGVCTNKFAADDGKVVALDHGCGGHSEIVVDLHSIPTGGMVFDDNNLDTTEVSDEEVVETEVTDIDEDDDDDTEVEDLDLSVDVIDESELEVSEEEN
ncbi:hypothetical protein GM51_9945 [freshwater metagenome]|uniref:DUF3027 domain-containing protein n=1 Tax=freshwater metagenome TaxID=449393 RepID=A0A094Q6C6_9ZZZZ